MSRIQGNKPAEAAARLDDLVHMRADLSNAVASARDGTKESVQRLADKLHRRHMQRHSSEVKGAGETVEEERREQLLINNGKAVPNYPVMSGREDRDPFTVGVQTDEVPRPRRLKDATAFKEGIAGRGAREDSGDPNAQHSLLNEQDARRDVKLDNPLTEASMTGARALHNPHMTHRLLHDMRVVAGWNLEGVPSSDYRSQVRQLPNSSEARLQEQVGDLQIAMIAEIALKVSEKHLRKFAGGDQALTGMRLRIARSNEAGLSDNHLRQAGLRLAA